MTIFVCVGTYYIVFWYPSDSDPISFFNRHDIFLEIVRVMHVLDITDTWFLVIRVFSPDLFLMFFLLFFQSCTGVHPYRPYHCIPYGHICLLQVRHSLPTTMKDDWNFWLLLSWLLFLEVWLNQYCNCFLDLTRGFIAMFGHRLVRIQKINSLYVDGSILSASIVCSYLSPLRSHKARLHRTSWHPAASA